MCDIHTVCSKANAGLIPCNTVSVAGCKCEKCRAGETSPLIYSRLCENTQSAGPGPQLLIYYGAVAASRQERERQPGRVLRGVGVGVGGGLGGQHTV